MNAVRAVTSVTPTPWTDNNDIRQIVIDGLGDPFESEDLALDALETALAEAVMGQSLADVPVAELRDKLAAQGAYLSPVRELAKT